MSLNSYTKREPFVFAWILIPFVIFLNILLFGICIFSSAWLFFQTFLYSGIYFSSAYFIYGLVAHLIHKRLPEAGDMFRRIAIKLPVFYIMNSLSISVIFYAFDQLPLVSCPVKSDMRLLAIIYGCTISTIITFMNEAVFNWEAWKASITENEKLRNAYQRSKVLGLKGQINPHFLFNCFNTLSGLIQEDEMKAECFLDEMTKVHRYLLKNDDELLVPLEAEMRFTQSYLYLAKERFGDAINFTVAIDDMTLKKSLPPLSMQVVLENIIYDNALSKKNPLEISITGDGGKLLKITNSIHGKTVVQNFNPNDGLENLLNKYKMLNTQGITINEERHKRVLSLPLFDKSRIEIWK